MRIVPLPNPAAPRAHAENVARDPSAARWLALLSKLDVPHARWAPADRAAAVRSLSDAFAEGTTSQEGRTFLRLGDGTVELCIDRHAGTTLCSAYEVGPVPEVYAFERAVDTAKSGATAHPAPELHRVGSGEHAEAELSASCMVRPLIQKHAARGAEFADLQAILFEGVLDLRVGEAQWSIASARPFVLAEVLLGAAEAVLDAVESGIGRTAMFDMGPWTLHARVTRSGGLGLRRTDGDDQLTPWQTLSADAWVTACARFARRMALMLVRVSPPHAKNLRVTRLRRRARSTAERAQILFRTDSIVNARPEDYRPNVAPVGTVRTAERSAEGTSASLPPRRLGYTERWRALVPSMDLRGTFVAGDKLVLSSATETYALDRESGELVWRTRLPRGLSVATPRGLIRQATDGQVIVLDVETGRVRLRSWLAPRTSRSGIALPISGSGSPPQLLISEGERDVVSLDLLTGEPRWRYRCARGKIVRARRMGKLVYLTDTRSTVTALDVGTGQMVWRRRDTLGFHHAPTVAGDTLYVVAGAEATRGKLCALDAFSGDLRWQAEWDTVPSALDAPPVVHGHCVSVPVRGRDNVTLRTFRTDNGAEHPLRGSGNFAPGSSWTHVDHMLVVHEPTGRLVGIDPRVEQPAYVVRLGRTHESDVPRRLEPVLRAGVLFVPHASVHVIDPMTGRQIAEVPSPDAIPDLLRVDERCDMYVAEESGHVVAFGVSNQLGLVAGGPKP